MKAISREGGDDTKTAYGNDLIFGDRFEKNLQSKVASLNFEKGD